MLLGIVVDRVVCQKVGPGLEEQQFLVVIPEGYQGPALVCANQVGARPGDRILVAMGGGARIHVPGAAIDAAAIGIVEQPRPG